MGITGLSNDQPQTFHTADQARVAAQGASKGNTCSQYYGQNRRSHLPAFRGHTSFPTAICGYSGSALRSAYGMTGAATGKGQTVAYVEIGAHVRASEIRPIAPSP